MELKALFTCNFSFCVKRQSDRQSLALHHLTQTQMLSGTHFLHQTQNAEADVTCEQGLNVKKQRQNSSRLLSITSIVQPFSIGGSPTQRQNDYGCEKEMIA